MRNYWISSHINQTCTICGMCCKFGGTSKHSSIGYCVARVAWQYMCVFVSCCLLPDIKVRNNGMFDLSNISLFCCSSSTGSTSNKFVHETFGHFCSGAVDDSSHPVKCPVVLRCAATELASAICTRVKQCEVVCITRIHKTNRCNHNGTIRRKCNSYCSVRNLLLSQPIMQFQPVALY